MIKVKFDKEDIDEWRQKTELDEKKKEINH